MPCIMDSLEHTGIPHPIQKHTSELLEGSKCLSGIIVVILIARHTGVYIVDDPEHEMN